MTAPAPHAAQHTTLAEVFTDVLRRSLGLPAGMAEILADALVIGAAGRARLLARHLRLQQVDLLAHRVELGHAVRAIPAPRLLRLQDGGLGGKVGGKAGLSD